MARVPNVRVPLPTARVHLWQAEQPIVRCHSVQMGAAEFNTTSASRRFRPVQDSSGSIVPTIYGADSAAGALSETVFHDVPVRDLVPHPGIAPVPLYAGMGFETVRELAEAVRITIVE